MQPKLQVPEDLIIQHGMNDKVLYFIANGKCLVLISNHLRVKGSVGEISDGHYFGEISVIFGTERSAEIQAITHCTLGYITLQDCHKVWQYSPELYSHLKNQALQYDDQWINFKVQLLK